VSGAAGPFHIRRVGRGSRVGYLHGDFGNPDEHPFLDALGAHCEVVAPSLPGFDFSEPAQLDSIHDWIVALSEAVDCAGLAGGPVVASSLGAMLALELCAVRPEAFSELVLIGPYGLWDDAEPAADPWAVPTAEQPAMFVADPDRASGFYANADGADPVEAEVRRYRARREAALLIWPLPDHGLAARLRRVQPPVHLLWGAEDRIVGVSYLKRFAELLPDVRSEHVLAGAGHLAEWDQPREAAAHIHTLLRLTEP
jgi:pimeloyl-ACP methyl ester carboxylesterase